MGRVLKTFSYKQCLGKILCCDEPNELTHSFKPRQTMTSLGTGSDTSDISAIKRDDSSQVTGGEAQKLAIVAFAFAAAALSLCTCHGIGQARQKKKKMHSRRTSFHFDAIWRYLFWKCGT